MLYIENTVSLSAVVDHVDRCGAVIWQRIGLDIRVQVGEVYPFFFDQVLDCFL